MSTRTRSTRRTLLCAILVIIVVILLYAGLTANPVPETFHEEDKLYHTLGFAALALCTRLAFARRAWWPQVLAMLALGGAIEVGQMLLPLRTGSVWDFLFDALGVIIGLSLARIPFLRRLAGR